MNDAWEIRGVIIPDVSATTIRVSGTRIIGVDSKKLTQKYIDGEGLIAFPGVIDPHVHFRTPGWEYKEDWDTGARAALRGGVTTVFDMPNTPNPLTSLKALESKWDLVGEREIDYYFWFGATNHDNSREIALAAKDRRIVGLKIYMGSSAGDLLVDDLRLLRKYFSVAAENNMLVGVHAESETRMVQNRRALKQKPHLCDHGTIRNAVVETTEVARALRLQKRTGARVYFCHISTPESVELIVRAKDRGADVFVEVCPHHLWLTSDKITRPNRAPYFKMNPPLRDLERVMRLRKYVCREGFVDTIGSDHAPHACEEKQSGVYDKIPSGVPGVETLLPVMYNFVWLYEMPLKKLQALTSGNAARIFKLKRKGAIAAGYDADIVLFHPMKVSTLRDEDMQTKCGWTPFHGAFVRGIPRVVVARGEQHIFIK